jgi:hypothetical protein
MTKQVIVFSLIVILLSTGGLAAQTDKPRSAAVTPAEQELVDISRQKWQWMADKDVDKLAVLFHDKARFVHMSGTWKKKEELDIIQSGSIWYRKADVQDVAVEIVNQTAIVWSRIKLEAMVRGAEAITQFTVTEVFIREGGSWKLLDLTFSSVRDTHTLHR